MRAEDIPSDGFYCVKVLRFRKWFICQIMRGDAYTAGAPNAVNPATIERFGPKLEPPDKTACRACSECDGNHHWMWNGHAMFVDPREPPVDMIATCKHCDAIRRISKDEEF